jgi:hypothetical protein
MLVPTSILFSQNTKQIKSHEPAASSSSIKQQERTKPKRRVTVNIKNGTQMSGLFVEADSENLLIEIENAHALIKMDEITSIDFMISPAQIGPQQSIVNRESEAARDALKALRTIAAATSIGVNYSDYSRRLIDAKVSFDDATTKLSESVIKTELNAAWKDYTQAMRIWDYMFQMSKLDTGRYNFMYPVDKFYDFVLQNYPDIKVTAVRGKPLLFRGDILATIWQSARTHLTAAESALK